jgi:hypothetical protein
VELVEPEVWVEGVVDAGLRVLRVVVLVMAVGKEGRQQRRSCPQL